MKHVVQVRKRIVVNTDPERRCYDGCNASEEEVWTDWGDVCPHTELAVAEHSCRVFKEINPGREYRIIQSNEYD